MGRAYRAALIASMCGVTINFSAFAQGVEPARGVSSMLASSDLSVRLLANGAVISTCIAVVFGGLFVFHRRKQETPESWGPISVQTLGTIFFFPTLILLAVYLDLPKDAVTTILGAFLGYLFGRGGGGNSPNPKPTGEKEPSPDRRIPGLGGLTSEPDKKSQEDNDVASARDAELAKREQDVEKREAEIEEREKNIKMRETDLAKEEHHVEMPRRAIFARNSGVPRPSEENG